MYKSKQIVSKFVTKLLKYRILFEDTLTFLGLDYRDAYDIVPICSRYQLNRMILLQNLFFIKGNSTCLKWLFKLLVFITLSKAVKFESDRTIQPSFY